MMVDSKSSVRVNMKVEDISWEPSSEWRGEAREWDHFGACQEHADIRWIAQVVLDRCSQHYGVSDQQRIIIASEL